MRERNRLITDGPRAETARQFAGDYTVKVAYLDEAIEIASRLLPVSKGTVEIRPLFPLAEVAGK